MDDDTTSLLATFDRQLCAQGRGKSVAGQASRVSPDETRCTRAQRNEEYGRDAYKNHRNEAHRSVAKFLIRSLGHGIGIRIPASQPHMTRCGTNGSVRIRRSSITIDGKPHEIVGVPTLGAVIMPLAEVVVGGGRRGLWLLFPPWRRCC